MFAPSVFSQGTAADELLMTIPSSDCLAALRVAPDPIRFYHRLADCYVAGTTRQSFAYLNKKGMDVVILDAQPWTDSYALASYPHASAQHLRVDGAGARVLLSGSDFFLVKGSTAAIDELRKRGFVCIAIERVEIPVDATTTRAPRGIGQRDHGVVDSLITFVSDTSVRNYIQAMQNFGTRYWNNANRDSVSRWVKAHYMQAGVLDVRLDSFQYNGTWQANVVATIPGAVDPTREIIVGGHHDSYSSNVNAAPGADDNASGAAAAIEMARVLKATNYQPAYTLRFMGFAAEEAGLRGSASYAQRARAANRDIRAMLNYDMIGNRNQTQTDRDVNVVWYTGSEALANLHLSAGQSYTTLTPILSTSSRSGSDSYSFWQQNYKTVFLIERDFSPYYHSPNDLLQYLDMPYCADIVRSGLATLLTLDQMPPSVQRLSVRDVGNGSSLFASWDSVATLDFANYKISVGRIPGVYDTAYTQTSRTRTIGALTEGQRYFIGVSVVDIAGREGFITEVSATPRSVPLPPAGLTAQSQPQSVRLSWRRNDEMDLAGYNVYRKNPGGATFNRINAQLLADTLFADALTVSGTYNYFVTAQDATNNESAPSDTVAASPTVGVEIESLKQPFSFALHRAYPNPFNPTTQIKYEIGTRSNVELKVYNILGAEVATLVHEVKSPGVYVAVWSASEMSSGVYFYRLRAGGFVATKKLVLQK
jgi:hypothetical protein